MKGGILAILLVGCGLAAPSVAPAASSAYTYNANGNLASRLEGGIQWMYVYDSRDQLREVRRDGVLLEVYQYDVQGRRIRKTSSDGIARYVWDRNRVVEETDDFGNTIAKYQYAGDRILSVEHVREGLGFYVLDSLGTPIGLTRPDGSSAARYRLDAWGVLRAENGSFPNPFRFTGHQFDEATGLYYARARFYDASVGRFLTEDPLEGAMGEPPSLHRYLYAHANPLSFVDPDGRDAVEVLGNGGARILNGQELHRILVQQEGLSPQEASRVVILSGLGTDIGADVTAEIAPWVIGAGELSMRLWVGSAATGISGGLAAGAAASAGLGAVATDLLVGGAGGLGAQLGEDVAAGDVSPSEDYFLSAAVGAVGGRYTGKVIRGFSELSTPTTSNTGVATLAVEGPGLNAQRAILDTPPRWRSSPGILPGLPVPQRASHGALNNIKGSVFENVSDSAARRAGQYPFFRAHRRGGMDFGLLEDGTVILRETKFANQLQFDDFTAITKNLSSNMAEIRGEVAAAQSLTRAEKAVIGQTLDEALLGRVPENLIIEVQTGKAVVGPRLQHRIRLNTGGIPVRFTQLP